MRHVRGHPPDRTEAVRAPQSGFQVSSSIGDPVDRAADASQFAAADRKIESEIGFQSSESALDFRDPFSQPDYRGQRPDDTHQRCDDQTDEQEIAPGFTGISDPGEAFHRPGNVIALEKQRQSRRCRGSREEPARLYRTSLHPESCSRSPAFPPRERLPSDSRNHASGRSNRGFGRPQR